MALLKQRCFPQPYYAHIQTAPTAEVPIGPHMPVNVCIGACIYAGCTVCKFAVIAQWACNIPVVQVACTLYKGLAYQGMPGNALDMFEFASLSRLFKGLAMQSLLGFY